MNWPTYFCYPWNNRYHCSAPPQGFKNELASLGAVVNSLMPYIFALSGIALLLMIVFSGYQLLTSAGNPESMEKGKKRLTAALVGFLIIFAAFWIWQLVQVMIGTSFEETLPAS